MSRQIMRQKRSLSFSPRAEKLRQFIWQTLIQPGSKASQAIGIRVAMHCRGHRPLDLLLIAKHRRQKRTQETPFPLRRELEIQCDGDGICIRALMSGVGPARSGLGSLWTERVAYSPQSMEYKF